MSVVVTASGAVDAGDAKAVDVAVVSDDVKKVDDCNDLNQTKATMDVPNDVEYVTHIGATWSDESTHFHISRKQLDELTEKDTMLDTNCPVLAQAKELYKAQIKGEGLCISLFEVTSPKYKYYRIVFDVDDEKGDNVTDITNCYRWLSRLEVCFGKCSVGDYTNDEEVHKQFPYIKYIPNTKKFYSMHAVFYTTAITLEQFKKLFDDSVNQTITINGFPIDYSIYKEIINNKSRLLRISTFNKVKYGKDTTVLTAANIHDLKGNPLPTSTNLMLPDGTEKLLTDEELIASGLINEVQNEVKKETKTKAKNDIVDTDQLPSMEETDEDISDDAIDKFTKKCDMTLELFDALADCCRDKCIDLRKRSSATTNNGTIILPESATPQLYSSMLKCENAEITREHIDDTFLEIVDAATRSDNLNKLYTKASEWQKHMKVIKKDIKAGNLSKTPGYFVDTAKMNREKYRKTMIAFMRKAKNKENEQFRTSPYTINDFADELHTFTSLSELISKLTLCVAKHKTNGYIIKQVSEEEEDHGAIIFQHIKHSELSNSIGDLYRTFETPDEKGKTKNVKYVIGHLLKNADSVFGQIKKYDGIALMSTNKKYLNLYEPPPKTNYNKQLIIDWIEFIKGLLKHEEPFIELLNSHAWRFKHPLDYIEKFFVNYGKGHNGKSHMAACLAKMYPNLSNVGIRQEQLEKDLFNAWVVRNLFMWIEEVQKETYQTGSLEQKVKLMTTKQASVRGMYDMTKNARNWAIIGMNTNKKDLYGLIRSNDPAVHERLVILDFKTIKRTEQEQAEFDKKCHYFSDHPDFAYSLYYYLNHDWIISEDFNPVRYYKQDKWDFIKNALIATKNSVMNWFINSYNCEMMIRKTLSVKVDGVTQKISYRLFRENECNDSYTLWKANNKSPYNVTYIKETMTKTLGFDYKKKTVGTRAEDKNVPVYFMKTDDFDKLIDKLNKNDDDEEEEQENEVQNEEEEIWEDEA